MMLLLMFFASFFVFLLVFVRAFHPLRRYFFILGIFVVNCVRLVVRHRGAVSGVKRTGIHGRISWTSGMSIAQLLGDIVVNPLVLRVNLVVLVS